MAERLVSIIIPVYNSENCIIRCLNSVLNQTYKNIEIILINDGSTDNSEGVIREYINSHSQNLIKFISQNNKGVSAARNSGLNIASGDYICFLDSDDEYHENFVSSGVHKLSEKSDYAICEIGHNAIRNDRCANYGTDIKKALDDLCLLEIPVSACAYMYSRQVVSSTRFDSQVLFFEDFLFNYYVFQNAKEIYEVDEKNLYIYNQNPNGANGSPYSSKRKTALIAIDKIANESKKGRIVLSDKLWYTEGYFIESNLLSMCKSNYLERTDVLYLKNRINNIPNGNLQDFPLYRRFLFGIFKRFPFITIKMVHYLYYMTIRKVITKHKKRGRK